jgi:AcrR family transcriptional regulator
MYWIMASTNKVQKKDGYHHGDLRAQLVAATRELVEAKGADHFSVSEACRVAGVSTAAPYRHFKDKEEMLVAVALDGMERKYQRMVKMVSEQPEQSLQRIQALGQVYVGFATEEPGVFRLIFGQSRDDAGHEKLMEMGPRHYGFVESEVAKFLGRNEVDDDARNRAFMLWTFVHGLSYLLIDMKTAILNRDIDVDALLLDIGRRVMVD